MNTQDGQTPEDPPGVEAGPDEARRFWDQHYQARRDEVGRPNPRLVEIAEPMAVSSALDLGCGAGSDTIWLARRGWHVTAVDISAVAVGRVQRLARELGVAHRVVAEQHDLASTFPDGHFGLISAQYLHTPFALDRREVLRTAANALRTGGLLVLVDHGSTAPWSWNQDPDRHYPTATELDADLDLASDQFSTLRATEPRRQATGPNGETATITDTVLVIHRTG